MTIFFSLIFFINGRQTQKVVADLVASEFYQQGDIEKEQLNIEPIVSEKKNYFNFNKNLKKKIIFNQSFRI